MDAAHFAEFWRMQGHQVIATKSCYWYNPQPLVFMSVPYHRSFVPSRRELRRVLLGGPAAAARFHDPTGSDGGLFICSDREYDFPALLKKARNETRRGLENCSIEQVDFPYLAKHGFSLVEDTLRRQGRGQRSMTHRQWLSHCNAAGRIRGFEAWSAFVKGRLAAFMVTALVEDYFSILQQYSARETLAYHPNNALAFTVTKLKLSSDRIAYVSYGLKSLEPTPGVDHFKRGMGFQLRPFGESVAFNPLLTPLLSLGGDKLIRWMARKNPQSDLWRKASAVARARETRLAS
jgi:hypothetical protein